MKRGFPATPVADIDGNLHPSPWTERRANGYVAPRDRPIGQNAVLPPLPKRIVSPNGAEMNRLREMAQVYTSDALAMLAHISKNGRNEAARVAACIALLDRGHGKPSIAQDVRPSRATNIAVVFPDQSTFGTVVHTLDAQPDTDTDDGDNTVMGVNNDAAST